MHSSVLSKQPSNNTSMDSDCKNKLRTIPGWPLYIFWEQYARFFSKHMSTRKRQNVKRIEKVEPTSKRK